MQFADVACALKTQTAIYYFSDVTEYTGWSVYGEETWPFRNNYNDPLVCFNAGAYGIKSDESGFAALVVGAGSALAWYISVPRLGLLALGDLSQRFLLLGDAEMSGWNANSRTPYFLYGEKDYNYLRSTV